MKFKFFPLWLYLDFFELKDIRYEDVANYVSNFCLISSFRRIMKLKTNTLSIDFLILILIIEILLLNLE